MDPVTRQLVIIPLKSKASEEVALAFDKYWLCKYPYPNHYVHDQRKEFTGRDFQEMLQSYGIQDVVTTVKNLQENATLEKVHQVIDYAIKMSLSNDQVSQLKLLKNTVFAHRASYHWILGKSPYEVVFSGDMTQPNFSQLDLEAILKRKIKQVTENVIKENAKRIEYEYQVGDEVMVDKSNPDLPKCERKYKGPYPIMKVYKNGDITVD